MEAEAPRESLLIGQARGLHKNEGICNERQRVQFTASCALQNGIALAKQLAIHLGNAGADLARYWLLGRPPVHPQASQDRAPQVRPFVRIARRRVADRPNHTEVEQPSYGREEARRVKA